MQQKVISHQESCRLRGPTVQYTVAAQHLTKSCIHGQDDHGKFRQNIRLIFPNGQCISGPVLAITPVDVS